METCDKQIICTAKVTKKTHNKRPHKSNCIFPDGSCEMPSSYQGDWFSMERGDDLNTLINPNFLTNIFFEGKCIDRKDHNDTMDANGNFDSHILLRDSTSDCFKCYYFIHRTLNIIQYKQCEFPLELSPIHPKTYIPPQTAACRFPSPEDPTLEDVCSEIEEFTDTNTFFRKTMQTVNCKTTFEGVFHFTYEWDVGGGGICNSPYSQIVACQEPGSPYVDNQVFNMNYGKCSDVTTSANIHTRFQCMGSWEDPYGNVWAGVADLGQDIFRERFRCMLTRHDQQEDFNRRRWTMSWWADCSSLKSPYEGPVRLVLEPVVGGFQLDYTEPQCNFPTNYSGHWYHTGEYDVAVDINNTHIYFNTKLDQFSYREAYFICMMHSGTRYLTVAITVGKCEVDFVCFDMLPRHHSIIRWRMGKPYRMTEIELAYPDFEVYMFRQACTWSSFTIDRDDYHWNYKTFLLDPPAPMPCPLRGRYFFTQSGPESELFRTRIRGLTVRPRHMIDCREYVTEFKSCDETPFKISIDAEYCETVDHTGHPVGEYDEADWELTCVGHWDEDWNSYMITWDPEDVTSAFRCWNYERLDWRHIQLSRSTGASCSPLMSSKSDEPKDGASLALQLVESERQFDDCAQNYMDGDPWIFTLSIISNTLWYPEIHNLLLWKFESYLNLRQYSSSMAPGKLAQLSSPM
ncbi:hypothetical protein CAPTEDRAFT_221016 [Capitella teleta]|uniref:Uncharacterized protein n=1 Tax=Capitella teleta TaxID=283909 RepID=R7TRW6_CAPTE|nr:hypothetical protein CAPTEDRAFT_221016 [Capitella teleta]|eukprot:ELT96302.1 hypothetical protein CAPTEDRAFT_221016 [Capitella teleta]